MSGSTPHSIDIQQLFRRMSDKGRRYELQLCNDIYTASNGELFAEPVGYSGNHNIPSPDIRVDDGNKIHAFELKNKGTDRVSFFYDPDDRDHDDIYQLLSYAQEYPRTVVPYVGVKFNRRLLIAVPLWVDAPNDIAAMRSATKLSPCTINLTGSDNLSVQKPDTDVWPSAQKGNDAEFVLELINYDR